MLNFRQDMDWQGKAIYANQVKAILGPLLISAAPLELDLKRATDFVLSTPEIRIACRLRRPGYADSYPWDFTIRSKRDTGAMTELAKILAGEGDWAFYGHISADDTICRWFVVNLDAFRHHYEAGVCGDEISNGDGTYFCAFDVRFFPPEPPILVASSHTIEEVAA